MYPAFAKDQLTTNRAADDLGGLVWSCVSKQDGMQGRSEPKPFAHRSGRSFGQFDLSICIVRVGLSNGTAARLANPEDRH
jgi:hypothetical protein